MIQRWLRESTDVYGCSQRIACRKLAEVFVRVEVPYLLLIRSLNPMHFTARLRSMLERRLAAELENGARGVLSVRGPSRFARRRAKRAAYAVYGSRQAA